VGYPKPSSRLRWWAGLTLAVAVAAVLAIALVGCARETEPVVAPEPEATVTPPPSDEETRSVPPLDQIELTLEPVVDGLDAPLFVTHAGDGSGRLFVLEQPGRVRVVRDGVLLERYFLDVSGSVSLGGERGLLGIAFAPEFERSGRFYVNYTDTDGATTVVRYTAEDPDSDAPVLGKPEEILRIDQPYSNHNGGCVVFGPDGFLYIGMGDGGSGGDPENRAQDPDALLGKMLRIEVEGHGRSTASQRGRYGIPVDNPSVGGEASEIWALGLRNPWRFSFDRATGDLWIGDVGQSAWEEIDFQKAGSDGGENYGWNRFEGSHSYPEGDPVSAEAGYVFPVVEYSHDAGRSITGGYVYRGTESPDLVGVYLYGDFGTGRIWGFESEERARMAGRSPQNREFLSAGFAISSFGEDELGEVYVVDYDGGVYRITASQTR
jgi:glucose/arabinose dehydrogenase